MFTYFNSRVKCPYCGKGSDVELYAVFGGKHDKTKPYAGMRDCPHCHKSYGITYKVRVSIAGVEVMRV